MTKFGPAIQCKSNDGDSGCNDSGSEKPKTKFLNIKTGMDIDMDRLKRGEYSLDELVDTNRCLGEYQDTPLFLKTGRYGAYLEWNGGANRSSLKNVDIPVDQIDFNLAKGFLDKEFETLNTESDIRHPPMQNNILRPVNMDLSIRKGKFGPYIFYKTPKMREPAFYNLRGFKEPWNTCSVEVLMAWIEESIKKGANTKGKGSKKVGKTVKETKETKETKDQKIQKKQK
jgi:topoisomerase IA-like protein